MKIKGHDYVGWFLEDELNYTEPILPLDGYEEEFVDIEHIPPLESDEEEKKEGKGLQIFTPNKLLTRLPVLLAQIKAGNNSYKLKNEIRQIVYLLYQHKRITKIFTAISSSHYNNGGPRTRNNNRTQNFSFRFTSRCWY